MTTILTPRHNPLDRARLAFLILSPVLVLVVLTVTVSLVVLAGIGPAAAARADAGLARVGDDLALVIVTDGTAAIAGTRELIADWGILAPAAFLVASSLVAWWLSGRIQGVVDAARTSVDTADLERQSRLQEAVHELRTPLAVMSTNLELARNDAPQGDRGRYVDAARRAVERMSRTVDDLSGQGRMAVEHRDGPVDLAVLADGAAAEHVGPARAGGIHIALAGSGTLTVDGVDPAAVQTALGNFVTNSIRLAPRGSVVTIDWGETDGWGWLSVTDEGPGIPPHLHHRAFERGWQGPHARHRHQGSGLGLTIARQMTEAQGGAVTLESEEGGGATLALWLPLRPDSRHDQVVAADHLHPLVRPWLKTSVSG